ncbi:hypothetical protein HMSSN036_87750 [Paenibacillus macerans]|nr:hypothetical protein HMSSN036_87750 [Paenibacillus macerans]
MLDIRKVAEDLKRKADWAVAHLRQNEWIQSKEGYAWFNGYYNNDGERVEGDHPDGVRMTLTGQVFAIMGGVATDEQTEKISQAVNRYLKDERIGYRLNSRFGGIQQTSAGLWLRFRPQRERRDVQPHDRHVRQRAV